MESEYNIIWSNYFSLYTIHIDKIEDNSTKSELNKKLFSINTYSLEIINLLTKPPDLLTFDELTKKLLEIEQKIYTLVNTIDQFVKDLINEMSLQLTFIRNIYHYFKNIWYSYRNTYIIITYNVNDIYTENILFVFNIDDVHIKTIKYINIYAEEFVEKVYIKVFDNEYKNNKIKLKKRNNILQLRFIN